MFGPAWCDGVRLATLKDTLSHRHVTNDAVQQSVVLMEILRLRYQRETVCPTFDWLQDCLADYSTLRHLSMLLGESPLEVVLVLQQDYAIATQDSTNAYGVIHNKLAILEVTTGFKFICYPCREEARAEEARISDIAALDTVATNKDTAYTYRPKTCFGIGECVIPDEDTFQKRSNSWATQHANHIPKGARTSSRFKVKCSLPGSAFNSPRIRHPITLFQIWFHQQYVPTFSTFGEMRVYIATVKDAKALRRRRGVILAVAYTNSNPNVAKSFHARNEY
jgi:hypothetical protein